MDVKRTLNTPALKLIRQQHTLYSFLDVKRSLNTPELKLIRQKDTLYSFLDVKRNVKYTCIEAN